MRFNYCPETGELSIYATEEEFQLAAKKEDDKTEYRVIVKNLKDKDGSINLHSIDIFIEEFIEFCLKIIGDVHPDESIQDMLVLSTNPRTGFSWTSFLGGNIDDSSFNFFESIFSYALTILEEAGQDKKVERFKDLTEILSEKDFGKLTLAKILLCSIDCPPVWNVKKRKKAAIEEKLALQLAKLKIKIEKYEKKYGFGSTDFQKYYQDDQYPEKDMIKWLETIEDVNVIETSLKKYKLVESLADTWVASFQEN